MTATGKSQDQIAALRDLVSYKVQQVIDGAGDDDLANLRAHVEVVALLIAAMRFLKVADSVHIEANPEEEVARILSRLKGIKE